MALHQSAFYIYFSANTHIRYCIHLALCWITADGTALQRKFTFFSSDIESFSLAKINFTARLAVFDRHIAAGYINVRMYSQKSYPLFVDNTESFCDLGAAQHDGQMILARVVARQTLQVKNLDAPQQKAG